MHLIEIVTQEKEDDRHQSGCGITQETVIIILIIIVSLMELKATLYFVEETFLYRMMIPYSHPYLKFNSFNTDFDTLGRQRSNSVKLVD